MIKEENHNFLISVALVLLGMWLGGVWVLASERPRQFVMMDVIRAQNIIIERLRYDNER